MTEGKPWPDSKSEYVVPDELFEWALALRARGLLDLSPHVTAVAACLTLHDVAERYYTAAGFRN